MAIKLSILDQSIIYEGEDAVSTLAKTVALAQQADRLGYDTFYVSEHHFIASLAGVAPEVLIGYLLASTKKITVGSAGVMLQHFVPFRVAESFSLLHHLAPGRVVLGVGKAQGGNDQTVQVLQRDFVKPVASFDEKFTELVHFVRNDFPEGHPYASEEYTLQPAFEQPLPIVLLGGSLESVALATKRAAGLVYPYFGNGDEKVLQQVRKAYQASNVTPFVIAVLVYITDNPEEAKAYLDQQASYTVILPNKRLNFNSQQTAQEYAQQHQSAEPSIIERPVGAFVGNAEEVKAAFLDFSQRFETEHFIIHTPGVPYQKKQEMLEILAQELLSEGDDQNE